MENEVQSILVESCVCVAKHEGPCETIFLKDPEQFEESRIKGLQAYNFLEGRVKNCLGETLTIIDASIFSEKQNKAVKDVIKKSFYRMLEETQSYCSRLDTKNGSSWGASINLDN